MTRIIRKIGSLLLACLLTVLPLCGQAASAEGLLEAMMDIALRAGRTIEGTIRIEAGDLLASLGVNPEGSDAMAFAAASDLLDNGLLRVRYTQAEERSIIGLSLELRGETVISLDVRMVNDEIALETNLLPGKTLVLPAQVFTDSLTSQLAGVLNTELLETLVGAAEQYATIAGSWAMQEGVFSTMEGPIPATQVRDAAARSMTLRVTDAQWQELLRSLLEEFSKDETLRQALASQMQGTEPGVLAEFARQWADSLGTPLGSVIEATIFLGEGDQIIGLDVQIEPPASSPADAPTPLEGSFTYNHRSIDTGHAGDSFDAAFTWGGGSELKAQFSRWDKIPSQLLPAEGEEYGGRALLRTPETGALELQAQGDIRRTVEPIAETYDHTFDMQLSQVTESSDTSNALALAQMLNTPLLTVGFTLSSQTEAIVTDDFRSHGSLALRVMGMGAAIHYTLESSKHTPVEHPENIVLRLETLTQAELDAITRELEDNAQMLLGNLMSQSEKPSALQAYTVGDESVPSIDSIIGFREITGSEAGITEGKPYVLVYYQAASALDDLQAYIDFLIDEGWAVTRLEGDASSGTVQLATESAMDGSLLMITADFIFGTYSILLHRTSGTLTRYTDGDGNKLGEVTITR